MRQGTILGRYLQRLCLFCSLILAACAARGPASPAAPSPENVWAQPTATLSLPTGPALEPTDVDQTAFPEPQVAAPAAPEATPTAQAAAVKTGLEATDPRIVALASGKLQLVEFFAFW